MGVTTVIPEMDATRPAKVNPQNIVEHIRDWNVTQAFGSPALWNVVGRYCEEHQIKLPTLKRVLSAGAPVPPHVLSRMKAAIPPDGDVTPVWSDRSAASGVDCRQRSARRDGRSQPRRKRDCVGRRFPASSGK
jgi:hypothetical protein